MEPCHDIGVSEYAVLRKPGVAERPELVRREPRIFSGVARGLSVHLGGHVWLWRILLLVIPGPFLYVYLAVTLPREESDDVSTKRLTASLNDSRKSRFSQRRGGMLTVAVIMLGLGLALFFPLVGAADSLGGLAVPLLIVSIGAGIAWSHLVEGESAPIGLTVVGSLVACIGALSLVARSSSWSTAMSGIFVGGAVLGALALVLVPVLLHNRTRLREIQEDRIREGERADIAAHLHDSVLQTLALIRARSNDPEQVAALARAQERDLRRYLYSDRQDAGESVAEQLRALAGEVEELFVKQIDVVITGDRTPTFETQALVGATREALTNACKHGDGVISLFAQIDNKSCEVFVRDRGEGFHPDDIGADRAGVKNSIYGRLAKVGGEAEIRSPLPSGGTEVRMAVTGMGGETS